MQDFIQKYKELIESDKNTDEVIQLLCEMKNFKKAALGLAGLAGLGIMDYTPPADANIEIVNTNKTCKAPEYIDNPVNDEKVNNMKGINGAIPNWRRHRIDYTEDGKIRYSLGLGNLSSRAHNPGNLVVNDMESAKKIGAIAYYQIDNKGNKYAIFPDDETGLQALENWWFTGNNSELTVRKLLPKFAPKHENDLDKYFSIMNKYCVPLDKPLKDFDKDEKTNLLSAVKTHEGFQTNKATEIHIYDTK